MFSDLLTMAWNIRLSPPLAQLVQSAFLSRLFIWSISVIVYNFCSPYDSSSISIRSLSRPLDKWVDRAFGMFGHWDGVFFLQIAEYGYEFEKFHAFFPAFPGLMRITSFMFSPLEYMELLSKRSSLILSGVLISNLSFILSTLLLYHLTLLVFKNHFLAYRSAILYCLTPSAIFHSAIYTESIFSALSLLGMIFIESKIEFYRIWATLVFMLASCVRSNGIVLIGYIIYDSITCTIKHFPLTPKEKKTQYRPLAWLWIETLILCIIVALPFLLFNYFGYLHYCTNIQESHFNSRPWCKDTYPNLYSFVQKTYWGNGFLAYYQVKQIPNFVLATPMILLVVKRGIMPFLLQLKHASWNTSKFFNSRSSVLLSYILHTTFLLFIGIVSMHVQVITRFLAASTPVVFWSAGGAITWCAEEGKTHNSQQITNTEVFPIKHQSIVNEVPVGKVPDCVLLFFLTYAVMGALLFSTFYPWT